MSCRFFYLMCFAVMSFVYNIAVLGGGKREDFFIPIFIGLFFSLTQNGILLAWILEPYSKEKEEKFARQSAFLKPLGPKAMIGLQIPLLIYYGDLFLTVPLQILRIASLLMVIGQATAMAILFFSSPKDLKIFKEEEEKKGFDKELQREIEIFD